MARPAGKASSTAVRVAAKPVRAVAKAAPAPAPAAGPPAGGTPCATAACSTVAELTAAIVSAQLSGVEAELLKLEVWDESFDEWVSPDSLDDVEDEAVVRLQMLADGGDPDNTDPCDARTCSVTVHIDAKVEAAAEEAAEAVKAAMAELKAAEEAEAVAAAEAEALAKEEAELAAAEAAQAAAEAAKLREITLMLIPNALLPSNRKLKVTVKEFDEVVGQVRDKFELPHDAFLSNVSALNVATKSKVGLEFTGLMCECAGGRGRRGTGTSYDAR